MENLIALAKKLKGFLLLAAIVFLGMALLLPKLFPGGIGDLESGDMVSVIQIVFGGFFLVTVLLLLLAFKKTELSKAGTLFVTVHEAWDQTAGIADAEVTLGLPEMKKRRTDENGNASFSFSSDHSGRKFPINAKKRRIPGSQAHSSADGWRPPLPDCLEKGDRAQNPENQIRPEFIGTRRAASIARLPLCCRAENRRPAPVCGP